jgi:membrane dipeptidase
MNRRDFLNTAAAAGAAVGLASAAAQPALAEKSAPAARRRPRLDPNDRSAGRDPLQVQRATLVVEGVGNGVGENYQKLLQQGGVNCRVNGAVGTLEGYSALLEWLARHKDEMVLAKSVKEIRQAHDEGKIAQVISHQYADFLGASFNQPVGSSIAPLRVHHEIGLRELGLCYNVVNVFGGGCLEGSVGLTRAGRRLVEQIHGLRIVLDVGGHTGEQTSLDAIALSRGIPIICSHTNIAALNDNPRCISDRLIDVIAGTGGVIGITAVSDFIMRSRKDAHLPKSPQASLDRYLDQFDYLKRRVGADHIALGSDNVEMVVGPMAGGVNREVMTPDVIGEEPWLYVDGFDSIAKLPNVTRGLIQRGWSNAEIHKVLGENLLRVYETVWGA